MGDVVISVDAAHRQAAAYDATLDDEIERLLIHGVLHLLGHDHEEPRERARMVREERRLAAAIGLPGRTTGSACPSGRTQCASMHPARLPPKAKRVDENRVWAAFDHAFEGILYATRTQRNMRDPPASRRRSRSSRRCFCGWSGPTSRSSSCASRSCSRWS